MKMPVPPPRLEDIHDLSQKRLIAILTTLVNHATDERYLHWDKLRFLQPPGDLTHEEWWIGLRLSRSSTSRILSLVDCHEEPFRYCIPDFILERLQRIDQRLGGSLGTPELVLNQSTRHQYQVSSLIEEALTSSQLEGAVATREIAQEMIRSDRKPRSRSEQMVYNNYVTLNTLQDLAS